MRDRRRIKPSDAKPNASTQLVGSGVLIETLSKPNVNVLFVLPKLAGTLEADLHVTQVVKHGSCKRMAGLPETTCRVDLRWVDIETQQGPGVRLGDGSVVRGNARKSCWPSQIGQKPSPALVHCSSRTR